MNYGREWKEKNNCVPLQPLKKKFIFQPLCFSITIFKH